MLHLLMVLDLGASGDFPASAPNQLAPYAWIERLIGSGEPVRQSVRVAELPTARPLIATPVSLQSAFGPSNKLSYTTIRMHSYSMCRAEAVVSFPLLATPSIPRPAECIINCVCRSERRTRGLPFSLTIYRIGQRSATRKHWPAVSISPARIAISSP